MNMQKSFTPRKILSLSLWSFLIGLAGLTLSIAGIFFYQRQPRIIFDVTNQADVINISEPTPEIAITVGGKDVIKKDLNLRVLTIKVANEGGTHVLQNHYDTSKSWGITLGNGKFVDVAVVRGNSKYLIDAFSSQLSDNFGQGPQDKLIFPKVIFESGRHLSIKVTILHDKHKLPQLAPMGKIAGVDKIEVARSFADDEQGGGLVASVFHGGLFVHVLRAFLYVLVLSLVVSGIVIAGAAASIPAQAKRNRQVRQVKRRLGDDWDSLDDYLGFVFSTYGLSMIERLERYRGRSGVSEKIHGITSTAKKRSYSGDIDLKGMLSRIHEGKIAEELYDLGGLYYDDHGRLRMTEKFALKLRRFYRVMRRYSRK